MISLKKLLFTFLTVSLLCLSFDSYSIGINKSNWVSHMGNIGPNVNQASNPPGSTSSGNSSCIILNENNMLYIGIYTYFLEPNIHEAQPMHLEYHVGDLANGVTDAFQASDLIDVVIDGIQMYAHIEILSIDLDDACQMASGGVYMLEVDYSISLVTPNGSGGYIPYLTYLFPNFWDPAIFPEANPANWQPPVLTGTKHVCCAGNAQMVKPVVDHAQANTTATYLLEEAHQKQGIVTKNIFDLSMETPQSIGKVENMEVYPNPFSEQIFIQVPKVSEESLFLEVFNAQGMRIYKMQVTAESDSKMTLNASSWQAGIYYFRLSNAGYADVEIITKL